MVFNRRKDYERPDLAQAGKGTSVARAKRFVDEIRELVAPLARTCESYEPRAESRVGGAPAVELTNGQLAIAPDLRIETEGGRVFWIEAKDKSQRFLYPDTGADAHQVLGWYDIWLNLSQPTFLVFQDPPFESCLPRTSASEEQLEDFRSRWERFRGAPYGSWLSEALVDDGWTYPMLAFEHTRVKEAYIAYFPVDRLRPIGGDWAGIVGAVDSGLVPALPRPLVAHNKIDGSEVSEPTFRKRAENFAGGR